MILHQRKDIHDKCDFNRKVYCNINNIGVNVIISQKVPKYLNLREKKNTKKIVFVFYVSTQKTLL